jgi:hypothetical protein
MHDTHILKFHALYSGEHGSGVQRHYAPYNLMGCPGGQFTNPVVPRAFPQNYGGQMLAGWAGRRAQADHLAPHIRPGVAPRAFLQDMLPQRFAAEMEFPEDDLQQRFNLNMAMRNHEPQHYAVNVVQTT